MKHSKNKTCTPTTYPKYIHACVYICTAINMGKKTAYTNINTFCIVKVRKKREATGLQARLWRSMNIATIAINN